MNSWLKKQGTTTAKQNQQSGGGGGGGLERRIFLIAVVVVVVVCRNPHPDNPLYRLHRQIQNVHVYIIFSCSLGV